jgi:hypothetical protein
MFQGAYMIKKIIKKRVNTVGQVATDLAAKKPETNSPIEQMREQLSDYEINIYQAVERGIKTFPGDFYVHVETKREPVLTNVLRNYFIIRSTCPTPFFDQVVYKYVRSSSILEFLWVIPSQDACVHLKDNALMVAPEERPLLQCILDYYSGELLRRCKILNGEQADSPLLIV